VLIWKINALIWFEGEQKIKENTKLRGSTLVGTTKGTSPLLW